MKKNRLKKLICMIAAFVGVFAVGGALSVKNAKGDEPSTVDIVITIPDDIKKKDVLDNLNYDKNGITSSSSSDDDGDTCDDILDGATTPEGEKTKLGAMQWVICPAWDNSKYTASRMDKLAQELLEIKTDTYSNDAIKKVWEYIRNAANILMIILLMLIIMSQLTGYGIDNYGIKKMLPRLIVMAIIINLSFYICQIAVDLSNILGEGLRDALSNIGAEVANSAKVNNGNLVVAGMGGLFVAASGAASTTLSVVSTAGLLGLSVGGAVVAAIVGILLALIIAIAILVLLGMIGARNIIIIFCIIMSPLAFAAFILPNTQGLFKKWWQLFKAALIIFPICGLVGGISNLLKGMSVNTKLGFFEVVIITILPYLVFFLIPMLLKQAISATGMLSKAFSNMGSTLKDSGRKIGQNAIGAAKNSEWGKRNMEDAARRRQQMYAARIKDRYDKNGDIAKRIEKAKEDMKTAEAADPHGRDARRARRTLENLQRQARWVSDATQMENKFSTEQEMADIGGVVPLTPDAITARAKSSREAQEMKGYTDQYSTLTRAQMKEELRKAAEDYNNKRDDASAIRLQAAIAAAESREMNDEMMEHLGELGLSATNTEDAKILNAMASSNNKVVSQFAKKQSVNTRSSASMNDFINGSNQDLTSMSAAFKSKGADYAVGMDEDTLNHILKTNPNALTTEQLIKAAAATSNEKELKAIHDMLNGRSDYNMSISDLSNLKSNTIDAIDPSLYRDALAQLKDPTNTDAARVLNSMDQDVKVKLGLVQSVSGGGASGGGNTGGGNSGGTS